MAQHFILPSFSSQQIKNYLHSSGTAANPHSLFYTYLDGENKNRFETLKFFQNKVDATTLDRCATRQEASIREMENQYGAAGVGFFKLKLSHNMAIGMGIETDFENGLLLHPVHGFPYINGDALKGAARAWAWEQNTHTEDPVRFIRIFGSLEKEQPKTGRGELIFFDAFPEPTSNLFTTDIITCHHNQYYAPGSAEEPGDWENPVPVPFLAVHEGVVFSFGIAGPKPDDVACAAAWLTKALVRRGIGAKRHIGYGHFQSPAVSTACRSVATPISGLENFKAKVVAGEKNLIGQASSFVDEICRLQKDEQSAAAIFLKDKISPKKLKEKADKTWVKTLLSYIGETE